MKEVRKRLKKLGTAVSVVALLLVSAQVSAGELQKIWCLKTDKGQYIEMARVSMLVAVDGQSTFEVVVKNGQGATGVSSVTFEFHESDYDFAASEDDFDAKATGPWCLITDRGDSIAMSRVQMLANVDAESKFEVVTREGDGATGVVSARFARGLSSTSGGFKPDNGEQEPETHSGPLYLITDKGVQQPMSNVGMLANIDQSGRFEVVLHDGGSLTEVESVTFRVGDDPTAIRQTEAESMLRLQTPVHFELRLSGCGDAHKAYVYDLKGAEVAVAAVADGVTAIQVAHLPAGIYIVKVGAKNLKFTKK